ncbi:MAG: DUF1822 family protein [Leptolyngbya sp. SIO4C5]|nr:DUF1822 family protein [Leptolyngbya sp. SIO4C5]
MTTPFTWLDNWIAVEPTREAIPLDTDQLDLSHLPAQERWAYRLQQLAVQGFERWLQGREPSLSCQRLGSPADIAASLQVGPFRVCLMPTSLADDEVAIPQAVINQPDTAAHFYVAIAIDEEAEVASLVGFLPYGQLASLCADLSADADQTYPLPTAELNFEINTLLLFLKCLSPSAITLPATAVAPQPELPSRVEAIRQPLANAGRWLQRQADELLPRTGWQPIPAMALRWDTSSVREQLTAALQHNALPTLPAEAGVTYQVITVAGRTLRLFAAVWPLSERAGDWMLLVVLCPVPDQAFPPGLSLVIDEITPSQPRVELVRETLAAENPRSALFAQVKGDRHDVFNIVIAAAGGEQSWSAALEFQPEV